MRRGRFQIKSDEGALQQGLKFLKPLFLQRIGEIRPTEGQVIVAKGFGCAKLTHVFRLAQQNEILIFQRETLVGLELELQKTALSVDKTGCGAALA